jgi:hypothetical protein
VDDEAEVGLVEPHTERRGGHEGFDLVAEQRLLGGDAFGVFGLPGVSSDPVAALAQVLGGVLGCRDREGVDDPGTGQVA